MAMTPLSLLPQVMDRLAEIGISKKTIRKDRENHIRLLMMAEALEKGNPVKIQESRSIPGWVCSVLTTGEPNAEIFNVVLQRIAGHETV